MVLSLANVIVIVLFTYFTKYLVELIFNRKHLKNLQVVNQEIEKMRSIPIKTLEEQKRFLDMKYPRKGKFKFHWRMIFSVIWHLFLFTVIFRLYMFMFDVIGFNFRIWQSILVVIIFPILFNILMKRFDLEKEDIRIFFRGGRKN